MLSTNGKAKYLQELLQKLKRENSSAVTESLTKLIKDVQKAQQRQRVSRRQEREISRWKEWLADSIEVTDLIDLGQRLKATGVEQPRIKVLVKLIQRLTQSLTKIRIVIFAEKIVTVERIIRALEDKGITTVSLIGKTPKQQTETIRKFMGEGESSILVTTPIGQKRLDVPKVGFVVYYDSGSLSRRPIPDYALLETPVKLKKAYALVVKETSDEAVYWSKKQAAKKQRDEWREKIKRSPSKDEALKNDGSNISGSDTIYFSSAGENVDKPEIWNKGNGQDIGSELFEEPRAIEIATNVIKEAFLEPIPGTRRSYVKDIPGEQMRRNIIIRLKQYLTERQLRALDLEGVLVSGEGNEREIYIPWKVKDSTGLYRVFVFYHEENKRWRSFSGAGLVSRVTVVGGRIGGGLCWWNFPTIKDSRALIYKII